VEDAQGQVLWSATPGVSERVVDERVAYLITDILSDDTARIPSFGQGSALKLSRAAAAKTGTTTDFRDNWTVGYTPELVAGVWMGNADNEPMHDVSGISGAAPMWHDFVESALNSQPEREFERPEGLVEVEVCALSGQLPERDCPHRVTELFLAGTEPTEACTLHQRVTFDRASGAPATGDTETQQTFERVYTVLPPQAKAWARAQGIPELPPNLEPGGQSAKLALASQDRRLVMSSPDAGAVYRLDPTLPRDAQRIVVSAHLGVGRTLGQVTLLVDGRPLAKFGAPPYEARWQLEAGRHVFSAEGVEDGGQSVKSNEVWVKVRE
jgi:membrane carboxypeptidase/penicillin-binding protein PbpC